MIIKDQQIIHFILSQMMCLSVYFLIVAIFAKIHAVVHFWYSLPTLLFYMFIYYLIFWKSKMNCGEFFIFVNSVMFFICAPIYFGVNFGLFYETMKYTLHDVKDCKVIGQQSTNIYGIENYSILYVDYKEGDQSMLGYACLSNQSQSPSGSMQVQPNVFLFLNKQFVCLNQKISTSYQQNKRILEMKRQRITASRSSRSNRSSNRRSSSSNPTLYCNYNFSEVKLASWMCLPFDTSYDELMKINKCYVHYYSQDNQERDQSIKNSKERVELKKLEQFAYISFNRLPIPLVQYMCLLIFCFCPFILSLNLVFSQISQYIIIQISRLKKKQKQLSRQYQIDTKKVDALELASSDLKGSPLLQEQNKLQNNQDYQGILLNQDQITLN